MKKILSTAVLIAVTATAAFAADVITLPAKNGNVTFPHSKHQSPTGCAPCHEGTPGKITLTKDSAHALCKGCHAEKGAGPVKCADCHKR